MDKDERDGNDDKPHRTANVVAGLLPQIVAIEILNMNE